MTVQSRLVCLAILAILVWSCGPGDRVVGAPPPPPLASVLDDAQLLGPTLVWVFRTDDCIQCKVFLPQLREAQRSGTSIQFLALYHGEQDAFDDVQRHIARERVTYDLEMIPDHLALQFEEAGFTIPFLVGVRNGVVEAWDEWSRQSVRDFIASPGLLVAR